MDTGTVRYHAVGKAKVARNVGVKGKTKNWQNFGHQPIMILPRACPSWLSNRTI
jgi:hypothetical protein